MAAAAVVAAAAAAAAEVERAATDIHRPSTSEAIVVRRSLASVGRRSPVAPAATFDDSALVPRGIIVVTSEDVDETGPVAPHAAAPNAALASSSLRRTQLVRTPRAIASSLGSVGSLSSCSSLDLPQIGPTHRLSPISPTSPRGGAGVYSPSLASTSPILLSAARRGALGYRTSSTTTNSSTTSGMCSLSSVDSFDEGPHGGGGGVETWRDTVESEGVDAGEGSGDGRGCVIDFDGKVREVSETRSSGRRDYERLSNEAPFIETITDAGK